MEKNWKKITLVLVILTMINSQNVQAQDLVRRGDFTNLIMTDESFKKIETLSQTHEFDMLLKKDGTIEMEVISHRLYSNNGVNRSIIYPIFLDYEKKYDKIEIIQIIDGQEIKIERFLYVTPTDLNLENCEGKYYLDESYNEILICTHATTINEARIKLTATVLQDKNFQACKRENKYSYKVFSDVKLLFYLEDRVTFPVTIRMKSSSDLIYRYLDEPSIKLENLTITVREIENGLIVIIPPDQKVNHSFIEFETNFLSYDREKFNIKNRYDELLVISIGLSLILLILSIVHLVSERVNFIKIITILFELGLAFILYSTLENYFSYTRLELINPLYASLPAVVSLLGIIISIFIISNFLGVPKKILEKVGSLLKRENNAP